MAKRPKIGDVVRITTDEGAADAQVTHTHAQFGHLLRVLGPEMPAASPDEIAARPTAFHTFFPLGAACARGIAVVLGAAPIPAGERAFPVFRATARGPVGTETVWWLWDGIREQRVGTLSEEQQSLPIREVLNDTLLVHRALTGWTPLADV